MANDFLVVGYSAVTNYMARNFKDCMKLNSFIKTIHTADDCVCATVQDGQVYCGQYAIVTFSTGVLQAAIREEENTVFTDDAWVPLLRYKNGQVSA